MKRTDGKSEAVRQSKIGKPPQGIVSAETKTHNKKEHNQQ
jgi:hypothetical protein